MTATHRRLRTVRYSPSGTPTTSTVSVVITCYNYARYLEQAVESALSQTGVVVDVVIVEDKSQDDSLAVAQRLAKADQRITVLANEHNLGAVGAFNRGLDSATGEYLVRLDADDLLTPGSLERAVAALTAFPRVGLVYGHPLHFSGGELQPARTTPRWWDVWSGADWLAARCIDGSNVITSPEVVMRGSVVRQLGGMRALAHTHDMELWLRIAAYADVAYVGGVDQAWHREHSASLSTRAEHPLIILAEVRAAFDELFAGLGSGYPGIDRLRHDARQALCRLALSEASRELDHGRTSDLVDGLMTFARNTDPSIASTPTWRLVEGRARSAPTMLTAAGGVLPRLKRRVRSEIRQSRWHRSGVYERLRLHRAGKPETRGSAPGSTADMQPAGTAS